MTDEVKTTCKHENLSISSYQVRNANTGVTLVRCAKTGQVMDFELNRIDGEVKEPVFYCEDCEESFRWAEVLDF